ncbi:hypothetical protein Lser_V15G12597 [Lactuca serriola]
MEINSNVRDGRDLEDLESNRKLNLQEMFVPDVDLKLLEELESMGFSKERSTRALHFSGEWAEVFDSSCNSSLEAAANWIVEHEEDADIDQMPLVSAKSKSEPSKPSLTPEERKAKAQEPKERARKKKEENGKRTREVERIRIGKELLEAKRMEEENERKRSLPIRPATKSEQMRECLRSLKQSNKDDEAKVKTSFNTLLTYIKNAATKPDEEKFRKIRLTNAAFQWGNWKVGLSFLSCVQFFGTEPYACEPSELPKYPPSKEIDVKLRDEEARSTIHRQGNGTRRLLHCIALHFVTRIQKIMNGQIYVDAFLLLLNYHLWYVLTLVRVDFIWRDSRANKLFMVLIDQNREKLLAVVQQQMMRFIYGGNLLGGVFSLNHFQIKPTYAEYPRYCWKNHQREAKLFLLLWCIDVNFVHFISPRWTGEYNKDETIYNRPNTPSDCEDCLCDKEKVYNICFSGEIGSFGFNI